MRWKAYLSNAVVHSGWRCICAHMRQIIVSYYKAMQGHPIHLWDALSGELRASYRVYNAADEVTAACSIAFDAQGQRLFAGLNNRLCIFDVARPGRYCKNIVPHSRASPGLQGNLFTQLSSHFLLSFFPCYDAPVSFVQVHTKWKPASGNLFLACTFWQEPWRFHMQPLHGRHPLNDVGLLCGCGCRHAYFYWVLALQASYRAWRATRTVQPCWLPAHI